MNYHNITYPDMNNGEGLRVVLWLSGCSHKCRGCQNHQTWDFDSGIQFDEAAKEELFRELDKDYISGLTLTGGDPLFEENLNEVLDLVTEVNKRYNTAQYIDSESDVKYNMLNDNIDEIRLSCHQKSIWLYTGYDFVDMLKDVAQAKDRASLIRFMILKDIDVLVDGKYIDSQRDITLQWRESKNQRVIDIQESFKQEELILFCK